MEFYGILQAMNQADLRHHYEQEKAKLNPEQLEAVETIEGPVMVLAGPGTGKTQVLAFRIAEILQKTDISPKNILALTFTESGVTAMRERLASLIGVAAYGVGIYTFHSFTNRIINDAGAEFYRSNTLEPIDDITQLKLVISLINELDDELLRPLRAPAYYVKPVLSTIKKLKNEGVAPDQLKQLCEAEIESIQASSESITKSGKNKGELKQSAKDKIKQFERSIALSQIYARYEEELTKQGLYDYEDMILFVVNSFRQKSDLLAEYQEQFQYILVDEYQDTNNAQNMLIRLLGDYFESPNIFVVGDDKQSIYRFQGASVSNLLNFLDWYPATKRITLRNNYRSGQLILDNATALIQQNQEQLAAILSNISIDLQAQDQGGVVEYTPYTNPDKETLGVVTRIKELLNQGVNGECIALLYRENSEAQDLADLFLRQGIPYHLEAGSDVLKDSDIRELLNVLELANDPLNEMALFRYFHAPFSGMPTTDLIALSRLRKQERTTWFTIITREGQDMDLSMHTYSKVLLEKAETWYRYAQTHNLGDTVEYIFRSSGLLEFIMAQSDQLERLQRFRCFFEEVKKTTAATHYATLGELFERITIRKNYNLPLIAASVADASGDAIRLMTAHKSKGLEFDYVFIPHVYDGKWGHASKRGGLVLPENIVAHHTVTDESELEEERRLFYVALTRAKKAVYLSSSELDEKQAKQMASQFLAELSQTKLGTPQHNTQLSLSAFFSPVDTQFTDATSRSYLLDIAKQQPITPTGLNTFLMCPMEYLYKEIYCVPGVREAYQAYGTAVHKAMETWGVWSKNNATRFALNQLFSVYRDTLVKEGLTEDEVRRYSALGQDVLGAYWETYKQNWIAPLATEYSFTPHNVKLDGAIPITGKIDKIEPIKNSKYVRVIDFKTGRVRSRNEIEGKTAKSDGDYKRQLVFYAVLAEADPFFPYKVGEASLVFLDDQKKFSEEIFEITGQEKDNLRAFIHSVYQEVLQLHFDHTPHKKQFGQEESLCDLLRLSAKPIITMPPVVSSSTVPLVPVLDSTTILEQPS